MLSFPLNYSLIKVVMLQSSVCNATRENLLLSKARRYRADEGKPNQIETPPDAKYFLNNLPGTDQPVQYQPENLRVAWHNHQFRSLVLHHQ